MLDDRQKAALKRWYERSEVLDEARQCITKENWTDLEEHIQMRSLFPLLRLDELPDYLKTDAGEALLPSLNPRDNQEAWEDAVEVGWSVVEAELGVTHDDVHRAIATQQKNDWASFMESVERRKREREG